MVVLREYFDKVNAKRNFLYQMRGYLCREGFKINDEWCKADAAKKTAAIQEGFKYVVFAGTLAENGGKTSCQGYAKTIAEAVSMIYHQGGKVWHIDKIAINPTMADQLNGTYRIGGGVSLDVKEFSKLIEKYDEKYINAEFSETTTAKSEVTISNDEEGFKTIVIRSIHNFTLGNYTESISELKNFVAKASGELRTKALEELQEWIKIARAEGVEVEDYAEVEETVEKIDEKAENKPNNAAKSEEGTNTLSEADAACVNKMS